MGARRLAGLLRGVLGVFGLVLALGCTPASAALQYPFVGELSGTKESTSVAVDGESGDALVGARETNGDDEGAVDVFDAAGDALSPWTGANTPAGVFGEAPPRVAVDDASGRVYVAAPSTGAVDVFEASGSYVCQITGAGSASTSSSECDTSAAGRPGGAFNEDSGSFIGLTGVAVDQATGEVYVCVEGHEVDRFSAAGAYESQLTGTPSGPFLNVQGLAVDDVSGELLVVEAEAEVVDVFDAATESFVTAWTGSAASNPPGVPGPFDPNGGMAVDDSTGDVYVGDARHDVVDQFSATGEYLSQLTGIAGKENFGDVRALAVGQATGDLYVATETREFEGSSEFVAVFSDRPVVVPDVSTGAASGVKAEGVVLEGGVNPDGVPVSACRFEYGTSTSYGLSAPCAEAVGAGTSEVAVHAELAGLAADTTYHYRLVASNANGTNYGADAEFHTLVVPVIEAVSSSGVTANAATLSARIDPKGIATTYHFEWGTSAAYGQSVPVPDGEVGAGESGVVVSQSVAGLSAGDTYHFRVVAQSANGVAVSLDQTFVYLPGGAGLPDGRAYELVTPPFKDGALVGDVFLGAPPTIAEDGTRIIVTSIQGFAGTGASTGVRNGEGEPYEFTRTRDGWVTTALAPSSTQVQYDTFWGASAESGSALFSGPSSPGAADSFYVRRADGSLVEVGPLAPPSTREGIPTYGPTVFSEDYSHILYQAGRAELWPFDGTTRNDEISSLYEYAGVGNAQPRLVGVSGGPGSTDLIGVCGDEAGSLTWKNGAISADGEVVFFTVNKCSTGSGVNTGVAVPADELYARIGGSRTVAISQHSPADCQSTACRESPPDGAKFQQASSDSSKAFFTSVQQLTDQASEDSNVGDHQRAGACPEMVASGCNLYEYDFDAPTGENLVAVSAGDTSGLGPRVQGVTAISEDGSHVYFVAKGVLSTAANAQGDHAVAGGYNLYLYERDAAYPNGRTVFIATLSPSDNATDWQEVQRTANVTPDGRFLVFTSSNDLTADDTSVTGAAQAFRYDAVTGELVRLSIGEHGFDDNGNDAAGDAVLAPITSQFKMNPTMSNDGSYVFFTSPAALVPGALNNVPVERTVASQAAYAENVYEYHDGNVYLISDGRDTSAEGRPAKSPSTVYLLGTDATGANVFFQTADSLVPQDTNTGMDIYDARICTSAEPCVTAPVAPAPCEGEACRGAASSPATFGTPASASFVGAGNLAAGAGGAASAPAPKTKPKHKHKATKPKKKRKQKRRAKGSSKTKAVKSTRGRK